LSEILFVQARKWNPAGSKSHGFQSLERDSVCSSVIANEYMHLPAAGFNLLSEILFVQAQRAMDTSAQVEVVSIS